MKIKFYELGAIKAEELSFVVISAKYKDKWIVVRHKDRSTWEMPGGHIEENETLDEAASRELFEETGALEFNLLPVCIYSVEREDIKSYSQLYYSEIEEIGDLPKFEIQEVDFVDALPNNLTYHSIQPHLHNRVCKYLAGKKTSYNTIIVHNKLVRDKIPEICKDDSKEAITRILSDEEYTESLSVKLREECNEFIESNSPEELADILEVIYAICKDKGIDFSEIEKLRENKEEKRGSFNERIFLIETRKETI